MNIKRCQCGADGSVSEEWGDLDLCSRFVECQGCGARGPHADTTSQAVLRWNAFMRPRPIAAWRKDSGDKRWRWLRVGSRFVSIGGLLIDGDRARASNMIDNTESPWIPKADARAWLEESVCAQGFDTEQEDGGDSE